MLRLLGTLPAITSVIYRQPYSRGMNVPPKVLRTKTPGFAHHSLAFSPFFEDRIAVASGANFGLVGNGRVHILSLTPGGLGIMKWCVIGIDGE